MIMFTTEFFMNTKVLEVKRIFIILKYQDTKGRPSSLHTYILITIKITKIKIKKRKEKRISCAKTATSKDQSSSK